MRNRKQNGTIIRIGDRWYVRFWEHRNIGGSIERKRVTHQLRTRDYSRQEATSGHSD